VTTGSTKSGLLSAATADAAAADAVVGDAVLLGSAGSDCSISSSC
jgi:hypothetical protein